MIRYKAIIFPLLLLANLVLGQTLKIKDSNFEACLVETNPQLFNTKRELILDSAKKFTGEIVCQNKGIRAVPELVYFESLTSLSLNQNKLTELPALNKLKKLTFFYVAENELTIIPPVDSLKELQQFICWKNKLKTLPDLTKLHKLSRLDVPVNLLTSFPKLSTKAPMKILLVDDNLIRDLPDLSIYPLLTIVKIVNNLMSFDQLDRIHTQARPAIYDYYPQKFFQELNSQIVNEGDSVFFSTTLDQYNSAVKVRWLKGNTTILENVNRLPFNSASVSDSGEYRAVLYSDNFPNQPLYTNSAQLTVRSCPKLNLVDAIVSPVQCATLGTIKVVGPTKYSYQLSDNNGNWLTDFGALKYGSYVLQIQDSSGCVRNYPEKLVVKSEPCKEVILSLDGDGYQDTYYFDELGKGLILDKFGNKIIELQLPTAWDGTSQNQKVSPGYYTLSIDNGKKLIGITVLY